MGCAASKVEHEDTVRRCKERRRYMKDAVAARQLLASAHADYLRSLRVTAATLSHFAQGHPSLAVSHHTAPVLLSAAAPPPATAHALPTQAPSTAASSSLPPPTPLSKNSHQPPPPLPPPQAAAAPTQKTPVRAPRPRRLRVPHILSESSVASPVQSSFRKQPVVGTPSSSSAWDWENFYPPSPPDSEFFERRKADLEEANRLRELEEEEKARAYPHHLHPHNLKEEDEEDEEEEKEGMHCGGWEDNEEHYASTTTSEDDGEMGTRSEYGFAARLECGYVARSEYGRTAPSEYAAVQLPLRRDERSEAGDSFSTVTAATEMRMVVRHRTLAEIVAAIEEYFVKAADAGNGVSELLEASRAQLDRNYRQLKSTKIHKMCFQNQNVIQVIELNSISFLLQRLCTTLAVCSQQCRQHGHQSLHCL
jgi:hypothetical protein